MAVNMLPSRSLQTAVSVGSGTAINTALFIVVVLMEPIETFWTSRTVSSCAAMYAFRSRHFIPLKTLKI